MRTTKIKPAESISPCVERIQKALAGTPESDAVAREIAAQISTAQRTMGFSEGKQGIIDELVRSDAWARKFRALADARSLVENTRFLQQNKNKNPATTIISFLSGRSGYAHRSASRIASSQKAALQAELRHRLGKDTILRMRDDDFARQLMEASYLQFHGRRVPDDFDPEAVTAAKVINEFDDMVGNINYGAGIIPERIALGWMRQSHDMDLIRADPTGWRSFMVENLDYEETFGVPANQIPTEELDQQLDKWFDELSSGVFQVVESQAKASARDQGRKIHFRSGAAHFDYWNKYGRINQHDTLFHAMTKRIAYGARQYGLAQAVGPNYERNLATLRQEAINDIRLRKESASGKELRRLERWERELGNDAKFSDYIAMASGAAETTANRSISTAVSVIQKANIMQTLGSVSASQLVDPSVLASKLSVFGNTPRFSSIVDSFAGYFRDVGSEEAFLRAQMMGIETDTLGYGFAGDWMNVDAEGGMISKASLAFNELTGARFMTDKMRLSAGMQWSRAMAHYGKQSIDEIKASRPQLYEYLAASDLVEIWDVLPDLVADRPQFVSTNFEGGMLDAYEVSQLPADHPSFVAFAKRKGISEGAAKNEIVLRLRAAANEFVDGSVVRPDATVKHWMGRHLQQGTVMRAAVDLMMIFKGYPLGVLEQNLSQPLRLSRMAAIRQDPNVGYAASVKDGLPSLGASFTMMTLLGAMSVAARDAARGERRDWTRADAWASAVAQGGGMGILGDFFIGDLKNRYGGGMMATLAGPVYGRASQVVDILQRMRDGDDVAAQTMRFAVQMLPGNNHILLRGAVQHYILDAMAEGLNPGSTQRRNERRQENIGVQPLW